ncbi:hypothetical protein QBC45DRAFT_394662 [Copromyces sp. CBS 386.78]|nr:hypothetical protein QBC45DRAFT_394662 [Copromyces sp. CBS 386.78]
MSMSSPSTPSTPSSTSTTPSSTSTTTTATTTPSHYTTLNVPVTATQSTIRAAFHSRCKAARTPGPNYMPSFHSSSRYRDLKEAYDVLSDCEDRKKYDISLAKNGDSEMGERVKREAERDRKMWEAVGKEGKEGGDGEPELGGQGHMRGHGVEGRKEDMERRGEWEVLEGVGEEVIRKWNGRPRGPRVRGTNV